MVSLQVTSQFPDKSVRNGTQAPVLLQGLAAVFRMVAEALVPVNLLKDESVALPQKKVQGFRDGQYFADDSFIQLRICGVSYVLFLYGGVDESRVMVVTAVILPVEADAFRQDQFHAILADTLAEMYQFARVAGKGRSEFKHPAKVLVT